MGNEYDWRQQYSVPDAEPVSEADLAQAISPMQVGCPFAVITAYRHDCTRRENTQRNADLERVFWPLNYSYTTFIGHYFKDETRRIVEESFLVFVNYAPDSEGFTKILRNLGARFDQDSVLIGTSDGEIRMVSTDIDTSERSLGSYELTSLAAFYSAWKGSRFSLRAVHECHRARSRRELGFFSGLAVQANRHEAMKDIRPGDRDRHH